MVKFFEIEARFPERHYEFPSAAVEFVAKQIRVGVSEFTFYQSRAAPRSTTGRRSGPISGP